MLLTDNTDFTSEATDQLRRNAGDLAASMTRASIRYRGAGQALDTFSAQLRTLQGEADAALAAHGQTDVAGATHVHAGLEVEALEAKANPFMPDDERQHIALRLSHAQQALQHEQIRAKAAESQWEGVNATWDTAAKSAASAIQDADAASHLNQGTIQPLLNWFDAHLQDIHDILEAVGMALAVISIGILIATGVGAPAGIALLAGVLAVMNLGITAIQFTEGKKSMSQLIFEGIFAVLAVVGAGSAIAGAKNGLLKPAIAAKGGLLQDGGGWLVVKGAKILGAAAPKAATLARLAPAEETIFTGVTWAEGKWADSALSKASEAAPSSQFWTAADKRPAAAAVQRNDASLEVTRAFAGFDRSPLVQVHRSQLRLAA